MVTSSGHSKKAPNMPTNGDDKRDIRTTFGRGKSANGGARQLRSGYSSNKKYAVSSFATGVAEHPYALPDHEPIREHAPLAPLQTLP